MTSNCESRAEYNTFFDTFCLEKDEQQYWNWAILIALFLALCFVLFHIPLATKKIEKTLYAATPWDQTYCLFTYYMFHCSRIQIKLLVLHFVWVSIKFLPFVSYYELYLPDWWKNCQTEQRHWLFPDTPMRTVENILITILS